ncbi:MAG: flagellin [Pseudorhodobacter sp.]
MTQISIGDMAQAFLLRQQMTALKQASQTAATEVASGRTTDISRHRGGDIGPIVAIETTLQRLEGFRQATSETAQRAAQMQSTLDTIRDLVGELPMQLLSFETMASPESRNAITTQARDRFDSVVRALNTAPAGKTLFAGVETEGPALTDADSILDMLETAITTAGATDAADIISVIDGWFGDPAGFSTLGYLGGAGTTAVPISPEDRVELGTTAADPALRDTLKSLATAALLERGIASDTTIADTIAHHAGEGLLQGNANRIELAARIGLAEGRIEQAINRNKAETTALQISLNDMLSVDPYDAAARLKETQSQLENLYAVTARISRLRLVDFLR